MWGAVNVRPSADLEPSTVDTVNRQPNGEHGAQARRDVGDLGAGDRERGLVTVTTPADRKSRTGKVRETAVVVSKPYIPPGLPNNAGNHAGGTAD